MRPDHQTTANAFDTVAHEYDAAYGPTGNAVMGWLRQESLTLLMETFPQGSQLLEIGCGTGEEALHLARAGRTVVATDVSPKMASLTRAKAAAAGLGDAVSALALPAGQIGTLRPAEPFDGAYASFGALNCEPDLKRVATGLERLLRPQGYFVCSVMARCCPFEIVWYMLHLRPRSALRRLRGGWQQAPVSGGDGTRITVPVRYLSASDVAAAFDPAFVLHQAFSLPLLLPPPYLDGFFRRHRRRFSRLEPWERRLRGRWPWRKCGDHLALVLRRR
jgi:ubiquinone/menaquinone biosynthesis C-methylase UbiE